MAEREPARRDAVLVMNPQAGRGRAEAGPVRRALADAGLRVAEVIPVDALDRLDQLAGPEVGRRPFVVAAGGDGTVGAVADRLAGSTAVLGILPLGTGNDVARSLGIPCDLNAAARLLVHGRAVPIDMAGITSDGAAPCRFLQMVEVGLGTAYTRRSEAQPLQHLLGGVGEPVMAVLATRRPRPFHCELELDGRRLTLELIHLSVHNAPLFIDFLNLRLSGSRFDDGLLDVLAVAPRPMWQMFAALPSLLLTRRAAIPGAAIWRVRRLRVQTEHPLPMSVDGTISGRLPAEFTALPGALRIVTPSSGNGRLPPSPGRVLAGDTTLPLPP